MTIGTTGAGGSVSGAKIFGELVQGDHTAYFDSSRAVTPLLGQQGRFGTVARMRVDLPQLEQPKRASLATFSSQSSRVAITQRGKSLGRPETVAVSSVAQHQTHQKASASAESAPQASLSPASR